MCRQSFFSGILRLIDDGSAPLPFRKNERAGANAANKHDEEKIPNNVGNDKLLALVSPLYLVNRPFGQMPGSCRLLHNPEKKPPGFRKNPAAASVDFANNAMP